MRPANRPSNVADLDAAAAAAVPGFQPAALTADVTLIRHWALLDVSGDLDDPALRELVEPIFDRFEAACERLALRNRLRIAAYDDDGDLPGDLRFDGGRPLLVPGYAAADLAIADAAGAAVQPARIEAAGARLDALADPPASGEGWPCPVYVRYTAGATAANPLPKALALAIAAEIRAVRDGFTAFERIVARYLNPYRRL